MAKNVNIIVKLTDAASVGVKNIKTGLSGIGTTAKQVTGSMKGLYTQIIAMAAIFTSGRLIGNAISIFKDFDNVMRQVGAVTNATGKELNDLTNIAKEMGATTKFTAAQAAEGLRLLGMAGFEVKESIEAIPGVLNLAAAGSIDLGTAADIATNVLAGFGLEVENLGQVNDVLVKTFTSSNTTLSELGESFKLVGPIAKGVGANFEDLLASIGKLGDAGLKGTLAGTALRGALNALFNPTKEESVLMSDLAKRIGQTKLNIKDASGNFIGFAGIIEQLERAGLKGEEALALFGQRAGPGMAALLQVGSRKLQEFQDDLEEAEGTSKRVANQMEAGIGGASNKLAASVENVKIKFGETFNDILISSIYNIKSAFDSLAKTMEEMNDPTTTLNGAIVVLTASFKIFGAILYQVVGAIKLVFAWVEDFLKITTALGLAIQGEFAAAKEAIKDFGTATGKAYDDVNKRNQKFLDDFMGKTSQTVKGAGKELSDAAKSSGPIGTGLSDIVTEYRKNIYEIEKAYDDNSLTLDQYFEKRKEIIKKKSDEEIAILRKKIESQKSVDEKRKLENQILIKQIDLQTELAQLDVERKNKIEAAKKERLDEQETILKAGLIKTKAQLDIEEAEINAQYDQNKITLKKYFDEREEIVKKRIAAEIAVLKNAAEQEQKEDKKALLNAQIIAKESELKKEIISINADRVKEQKKIDDDLLKHKEKVDSERIKAEQAYQNQVQRIKEFQQGIGLSAQFQKELIDLQAQQDRELQAIQNFNKSKLELLRTQKADEEEITKQTEENKNAIKQQLALQQYEREKLLIDQNRRLKEYELENIKQLATGTKDLFTSIYELTGKKNKELFYAAKAAAIAEATINIAQAVTKALAQAGIFGTVSAGIIAAQGAIQIATIASQSLAEGGIVKGTSPSTKSDDKIIAATSGEYMQPVSAVRKYGVDAMELIRHGSIDRERLRNALGIGEFKMPGIKYGQSHFATGGMVTPSSNITIGNDQNKETSIVNILDRSAFDQWAASKPGQRSILNVMSNNIFEVKKMILEN